MSQKWFCYDPFRELKTGGSLSRSNCHQFLVRETDVKEMVLLRSVSRTKNWWQLVRKQLPPVFSSGNGYQRKYFCYDLFRELKTGGSWSGSNCPQFLVRETDTKEIFCYDLFLELKTGGSWSGSFPIKVFQFPELKPGPSLILSFRPNLLDLRIWSSEIEGGTGKRAGTGRVKYPDL